MNVNDAERAILRKTWRNKKSRSRRWHRAYGQGARDTLITWSQVFLPLPPPPGLTHAGGYEDKFRDAVFATVLCNELLQQPRDVHGDILSGLDSALPDEIPKNRDLDGDALDEILENEDLDRDVPDFLEDSGLDRGEPDETPKT